MSGDCSHAWVAGGSTLCQAHAPLLPGPCILGPLKPVAWTRMHPGGWLSGDDEGRSLGQHCRSTQRSQGTRRPDRWAGLAQGEDKTKGNPCSSDPLLPRGPMALVRGVSGPGHCVLWGPAQHRQSPCAQAELLGAPSLALGSLPKRSRSTLRSAQPQPGPM